MVLRPRRKASIPNQRIAYDAALAFPRAAEPIQGFTSPHDHEASRRGIAWMREHYRRLR
jgi:hypothetical protein